MQVVRPHAWLSFQNTCDARRHTHTLCPLTPTVHTHSTVHKLHSTSTQDTASHSCPHNSAQAHTQPCKRSNTACTHTACTSAPLYAPRMHARTLPAPQTPLHAPRALCMHTACTSAPLYAPHALCMTCTQAQCTLSTLHPQRHTRHPTPHLHTHGGPQLCSGVPLLSSQKPPEQARGVVAGMAGMSQTEEELKPPNQNTPRPGAP